MHNHSYHSHNHLHGRSNPGATLDKPDFGMLIELLAPSPEMVVLDAATGGGATARLISPRVKRVVGVDSSPDAIEEATEMVASNAIENIELHVMSVDAMKLESKQFDAATCRLATHHLEDLTGSLKEIKRVLKSGGKLVIVDRVAPETPELSAFIHQIGKLRDCTFTKLFTFSEWEQILGEAGFKLTQRRPFRETIIVPDWLDRSPLNDEEKERMYDAFEQSSQVVRDHFLIDFDKDTRRARSITDDKAVLLAIADD